jgi:hypothetical protein
MPVWNKNVMTHPEDFDDKTTITRQITDNLNDLFGKGAILINEIKSTASGGSRGFRTKKKKSLKKTVPPLFTRTKAANRAHKNFTSGPKLLQRNTDKRVHRLSNRGNQPTSNNSPPPFRSVKASYNSGNPLKFKQKNVSGTLNRQPGIVYTPFNTKKNKNPVTGQPAPIYSTPSKNLTRTHVLRKHANKSMNASYSGFNTRKQPKYVAPTNIAPRYNKLTRTKSIGNERPPVYEQISNQSPYAIPSKILQEPLYAEINK